MDGKRLNCVLTAFIPCQQRTYHDRSTFLLRQRYVQNNITFDIVRSVFNRSIVRLQQILIASMSRLAIQYKYFSEFFTFSLVFLLEHAKSERSSVTCLVSRQPISALCAGWLFVFMEDKTDSTSINIWGQVVSGTRFLAFLSSPLTTFVGRHICMTVVHSRKLAKRMRTQSAWT